MPDLDRSIVEHRLPIKPGYRPFQQGARRCNPKVLPDIKTEITRLIEAKCCTVKPPILGTPPRHRAGPSS